MNFEENKGRPDCNIIGVFKGKVIRELQEKSRGRWKDKRKEFCERRMSIREIERKVREEQLAESEIIWKLREVQRK